MKLICFLVVLFVASVGLAQHPIDSLECNPPDSLFLGFSTDTGREYKDWSRYNRSISTLGSPTWVREGANSIRFNNGNGQHIIFANTAVANPNNTGGRSKVLWFQVENSAATDIYWQSMEGAGGVNHDQLILGNLNTFRLILYWQTMMWLTGGGDTFSQTWKTFETWQMMGESGIGAIRCVVALNNIIEFRANPATQWVAGTYNLNGRIFLGNRGDAAVLNTQRLLKRFLMFSRELSEAEVKEQYQMESAMNLGSVL